MFACKAKNIDKDEVSSVINAKQLVRIIADSSFVEFMNLVKKLKKPLIDSSYDSERSLLMYYADEADEFGISCNAHMTPEHTVNFLHFATYDDELFQNLRNQFLKIGFDSKGNYAQVEELVNTPIHVNLVVAGEGEEKSYEIILVREDL